MTTYYPGYTTQTIDNKRDNAAQQAIIKLREGDVPLHFPFELWGQQQSRYVEYWNWFTGFTLSEVRAYTADNKPVMKYPLGINPVRNFSRKHAAILLGEESYESPDPMVKTVIRPRNPVKQSEVDVDDKPDKKKSSTFSVEDRQLALTCQNIINEVWSNSYGRSIQIENATLSQFLGGCVFQVAWEPQKEDEKTIPITIKNIIPDFFMPVWSDDDYFDLIEAFVVYKIPTTVAYEKYGFGDGINRVGWATYCEHWTKNTYSIWINGKAITSDFSGVTLTYENVPNPFGFVPFVYIPHVREGSFWGNSIVEDMRGLVKEFNARYADLGDSVRDSVHRKRYGRDLTRDPKDRKIGKDTWVTDLGTTNPSTKAKPEVFAEDPPVIPMGMADLTKNLWLQLLREGQIGDVAFGEDEGSQRSALTLAFRMWPTTSHARTERAGWTDGLNQIAKMILKMVYIKQADIESVSLPKGFLKRLSFTQDWKPMIPRDREQMVAEIIARFQTGLLSPQRALRLFGDVEYIEEELELIQEWLSFKSSLDVKDATGDGGQNGDPKEGQDNENPINPGEVTTE